MVPFRAPRAVTASAVSDTSPSLPRGSARTPAYPPARAIHSRTRFDFSQDSFAGPISQDPEKQFLATSGQFGVPISELERVAERAEDIESNSAMFAYSLPQSSDPRPSPQGIVLVAATPSNSDGSQSQDIPSEDPPRNAIDSQDYEIDHAQPPYENTMIVDGDGAQYGYASSPHSTQGYESSAPSSSYARFLNGEPDPAPEPQATQPSTQPDNDGMTGSIETQLAWGPSPSNTNPASAYSDQYNAISTSTTTRMTAPRNLLSLVDPRKLWKYQHYHNQVPRAQLASAGAPPVDEAHAVSLSEETQPSYEDEERAALQRRVLPASRTVTPPMAQREVLGATPTRQQVQAMTDPMDVIPDSEPLRGASPLPLTELAPARGTSTAKSTPRKVFRRLSPGSDPHPNSGDIVPDSMVMGNDDDDLTDSDDGAVEKTKEWVVQPEEEEDDDEEDIPLATAARKQDKTLTKSDKGKGRAVSPEIGLPTRVCSYAS